MPCDTNPERIAQRDIENALRRLEQELERGGVTVKVGANGAVAFDGWTGEARGGMSDVCAYRRLSVENSFALRQAVQRAEAATGRKVDAAAVAAGVHSHDGGNTWHAGH